MSKTIDERVVSMQFDNNNFEKNVSTSMNTIDSLKKKLDFTGAAKGIDEISTNAESVKVKFSALEVVVMTVLQNITNSAVNAGKRLVSSLSVDQITAGWNKYDQKTASVQTIMNATGKSIDEVNGYLEKLMWFSDETSYGFTDMTSALGQLTSAGADIDNIIPMITGIANATAYAGKGAGEFSRAIYNLNQSYGSGSLKLMDWKSLELAGIAGKELKQVLIDTGVELGKIKEGEITLGSFNESLSKQWADTSVMEKAFSKFSTLSEAAYDAVKAGEYDTAADAIQALSGKYDILGEKAFKSAQEAKSFSEALGATKDAVSSGWMNTFEIIFGNYEEAKVLWTNLAGTLWDVFASGAEKRNDFLEKTLSTGWEKVLDKGIMDGEGFSNIITDVMEDMKDETGVSFKEMIKEEGSFEKALQKGIKTGLITSDTLSKSLNILTEKYEGFSDETLMALGFNKEQVKTLSELNEQVQNGSISMDEFVETMQKASGKELLFESFSNIFKALVSVITPIKEAFKEIFPPVTVEQAYKLIEAFNAFTKKLILNEEVSSKLKDTFKGVFSVLKITLSIVGSAVSITFKLIGALKGIAMQILNVSGFTGNLLTKFGDYVKKSEVITKVSEVMAKAIEKVSNVFKKFGSSFKSKIKSINLEGIQNGLKKFWNVIKPIVDGLIDITKKLFEAIIGENGLGFDSILAILNGSLLAGLIIKIKSIFGNINNTAKAFKDVFKNVMTSISDTLNGVQNKLNAEAVKQIAISIAILVGALLVLSLIEEDKLSTAIAAVCLALTVLIGAFAIINKMGKANIKNTSSLLKMTIALLVLSFALKKLASMNWGEIAKALVAMAGALAVLLAALFVMSKISKVNMAKGGASKIFSLSISLLLIASSLKILATMSWDDIGRSLTVMTGALAVLLSTLFVLSKITKSSGNMSKGGASKIFSLSISLLLIGSSLKILSTMSWNDIGRSLTAMGGALGILVGILAVLSKIPTGKKSIFQLTVIIFSLIALSAVLKILATMSWDDIGRSLTAMGGALLILAGTLFVFSKVPTGPKSILQLIIVVGVLLKLSAILKILATMDWGDIARSLTAMAGALLVLAGTLAIMSTFSKGNSLSLIGTAAALVVMSIAIAALVPSLILLGSLNTSTIVKGLLAIASAFAVLGIAALILKPVTGSMLSLAFSLLMVGASCFVISAAIGLFAVALGMLGAGLISLFTALKELRPTIGSALVGLINVIKDFVVALCDSLIEILPKLFETLKVIIPLFIEFLIEMVPYIVEGILTVLVKVLDSLITFLPKIVESLVRLIIGVIDSLTKYLPDLINSIFNFILGIINGVAERIPELIVALVNLVVKIFEGFAQALENIDMNTIIEGLKGIGFISALIVALSAIVPLIPAAMIGVIGVGAVIAELSVVLAAIGALSRIPGIKELVTDGGKFLMSIGTAIGQFVGGIIGGLAEGITSTLPSLATNLSNFMTNLQPFLNGLKQLDSSVLNNASLLGDVLLTITAANILDQLTSWLIGDASMEDFSKELVAFGAGIKGFADEVAGIDCESVKAAAEAGKTLAEMANNIPPKGGLWQLFSGSKDLDTFGNQLKSFGVGIKGFADKVAGIDCESVKAAAEAGKTLAEMANNIPKKGGLFQLFTGEVKMAEFGAQLKSFGSGIKQFANETAEINLESLRNGTTASNELVEMANKLPKSGGLWQLFAGEINMTTFGTQLKSFGTAIKDFTNEMAGIGDISGAAKQLDTLNYSLTTFSTKGIEAFTITLQQSKDKVGDSVSNMLDAAIVATNNKTTSFVAAGKNFIEKFVSTISSYKTKIKTIFTEIIDTAIAAISGEDIISKFGVAGGYLAEGFANGISAKSFMAEAKARAMAEAALEAAKEALGIESPSKAGIETGGYFGEGFVIGIDDYKDKAYESGEGIANSAKGGLGKALTKVKELIENGIDSTPTIRPVLDLSDIESGAGAINGMLGSSISVGASNAGYINSVMNKNQNGSNDDVVTAIKGLQDEIKNNPGNTYNINGITFNKGDDIEEALEIIIRAAKIEGRI